MNSRNCRIRGMREYTQADDESFNVALSFASHFDEWHSFLPPQTKFTYHGERSFNGISSDRYSGKVDGVNQTSHNIFEYGFAKVYVLFDILLWMFWLFLISLNSDDLYLNSPISCFTI